MAYEHRQIGKPMQYDDDYKNQQSNIGRPTTKNQHVLLSHKELLTTCDITCTFCGKSHDIRGCDEFLRLTPEDRWNGVSKRPLCYCCLRPDHLLPACDERVKCGVNGCPKWHSPLLHENITPRATHYKRSSRRNNRGEKTQYVATTKSSSNASYNVPESSVPASAASPLLSCREEEEDDS